MQPQEYPASNCEARRVEGWWNGRLAVRNRNPDGNLYVRYLHWNGDEWDWNDNWLDNQWDDDNPAVLRNYFHFSPENLGEFFNNWPRQPPSILLILHFIHFYPY